MTSGRKINTNNISLPHWVCADDFPASIVPLLFLDSNGNRVERSTASEGLYWTWTQANSSHIADALVENLNQNFSTTTTSRFRSVTGASLPSPSRILGLTME